MTPVGLEVLRTGPLALVEDLGRPGLAHVGVTRSGAADRAAHLLANRLVANPRDRATVEVTFGGFAARVRGGDVTVAVTGVDGGVAIDGKPFGANAVARIRIGQVLEIGVPAAGLRSYVAVRGGIAVDAVLGSRSHDVLAALGPPPLRAGDLLPVGPPGTDFPDIDQAPVAALGTGTVDLAVLPGPRDDWCADPDRLVGTEWTVTERSDRVGTRLAGRALTLRHPDRQLPSEGAVRGAIQVPPNGLPVILGPDHPVTGGYPVIGVLLDADADRVAQVRPGQTVRLHWSRPRRAW